MRSLSDLKVCFLAGTLGQGGAERQLFYMLQTLRNANAAVTLLTLTQGEYWERPIAELGVPIRFVGESASRWSRCRRIAREVKSLGPDVLHSQHFYTNLYAVAAARWGRVREIGSLRNDAIHEVQAHSSLLGNASLRLPRTMAVNSRQGLRNAIGMGLSEHNIHLLPNAIDLEKFAGGGQKSERPVRLCFVGRLTTQKRGDVFLRAVAKLSQESAAALTATIVGDGPDRARLEEISRELNLSGDVVRFVGAVSDPMPYYQDADIAVLTSDWEGTPNVILEAMAVGLPVVATDVGGVSDLVRHGETGFLAPAGDVAAIAKHLRTLATMPDLRRQFGERARRLVAVEHSLESLSGNLQRLYNAALAT